MLIQTIMLLFSSKKTIDAIRNRILKFEANFNRVLNRKIKYSFFLINADIWATA